VILKSMVRAIVLAVLLLAPLWMASPGPAAGPEASKGTWRLVRTPNPRGGPEAVSIMQTAETLRSDPDLAGLMLRCGPGEVEVAVVLVQPVSPRLRPEIAVRAGATDAHYQATVATPGALLLLPGNALALLTEARPTPSELSLTISYDQTKIQGVIPLAGLSAAYAQLRANCAQRQQ
jgi:hypothetical protein